jgi:hypothetical protein
MIAFPAKAAKGPNLPGRWDFCTVETLANRKHGAVSTSGEERLRATILM